MEVLINAETYETNAETLHELFQETHPDQSSEGKAIAVNDEVVPSGEWKEFQLSEGDRIEVIQAVQGG